MSDQKYGPGPGGGMSPGEAERARERIIKYGRDAMSSIETTGSDSEKVKAARKEAFSIVNKLIKFNEEELKKEYGEDCSFSYEFDKDQVIVSVFVPKKWVNVKFTFKMDDKDSNK
jgi:phosphatidate phosphatase PAH1